MGDHAHAAQHGAVHAKEAHDSSVTIHDPKKTQQKVTHKDCTPEAWADEPYIALFIMSVFFAQSFVFASGETWEYAILAITNPGEGPVASGKLLRLWALVFFVTLVLVIIHHRLKKKEHHLHGVIHQLKSGHHVEGGHDHVHEKHKEANHEEGEGQSLLLKKEEEVTGYELTEAEEAMVISLTSQKSVIEFVLDAGNFCLMAQWDYALRKTLPTQTIKGVVLYNLGLLAVALTVTTLRRIYAVQIEEIQKEQRKLKKEGEIEKQVAGRVTTALINLVLFLCGNLPWLLALAVVALVQQVLEHFNHSHSIAFEIKWLWVMTGCAFVVLLIWFVVHGLLNRRRNNRDGSSGQLVADKDKEQEADIMFKRLFKPTSALLLDTMGIIFVEMMQEAMGATLKGEGLKIATNLITLGTLLVFGYLVYRCCEYIKTHISFKGGDLQDDWFLFLILLSSRTVAFCMGFAIQMTTCELISETFRSYSNHDGETHVSPQEKLLTHDNKTLVHTSPENHTAPSIHSHEPHGAAHAFLQESFKNVMKVLSGHEPSTGGPSKGLDALDETLADTNAEAEHEVAHFSSSLVVILVFWALFISFLAALLVIASQKARLVLDNHLKKKLASDGRKGHAL